ncbi:BTAD domain-containing putative transcriptional regulator [Rhizobium rhizosphaerae]|nr:BTAD domain-containing putative transcriptional regulator [Xaviernesmea rhizosphaerae]
MQLRLFGLPHYGGTSAEFFPAKAYILLAALLLAPHQTLSRQTAASLLWEDVEHKRALGNLRQLILRMRNLTGSSDGFVKGDGNNLLAGHLAETSDLGRFLRSLNFDAPAERSDALLAVGGELLQGLDVGQHHLYLWLLSERRRLKDLFFSAYVQLMDELTRFGAGKGADIAKLTAAAVRLEPDREETYQAAMSAYARAGNVLESNKIFEALQHELRADGRVPEAATFALHRRLRSASVSSYDKDRDGNLGDRPRRKLARVAFLRPARLDGRPPAGGIRAFMEDVANSLARFRSFSVLAPHSTFAFETDTCDDRYSLLRVDYRVVARVFDDARLSVSLIDEQGGEIVWSLEIVLAERHIHSAFRVLSKQVAIALAHEIERIQIEPGRQHNGEAYRLMLEGQQLLNGRCDLPFIRRARSLFRRAIDLDHSLAAARARIAQTLQLEWLMLGGNDPHLLHRAKAEAEASREIDPALGVGFWMEAVVALYQRDFDRSAEKFFEAEALAPNSADLLLQHADALAHFGDCETAWEKFQSAIDLNPLAPDIYWWAGASIAFDRKDYIGAVNLCSHMNNDEPALRILTASHALSGDLDNARRCAGRLRENYPGMSARDIAALSPDRDPAANENFCNALRLAGIK